jgi:dTDP-4-dehydrorhamnose reductase
MVTGGRGQLGTDVTACLRSHGFETHSFGREELDITDENQVNQVVTQIHPDVIVHTAAYTQVDVAEKEIDRAYLVNAFGTRNIAVAAQRAGAKLVYISTDYVFDGTATLPYHEFSPTNPRSVYGKSKLAGEMFVQQLSARFFIIRTSWVYGMHGHNFVKTMMDLGKKGNELSVVTDQVGAPTYTLDLAAFIRDLIVTERYGIYHVSNTGVCSWYEFAEAIFAEANMPQIRLRPVTTAAFSRPAPRPAYSVFDHMAMRLGGFSPLRHWRDALRAFLQSI